MRWSRDDQNHEIDPDSGDPSLGTEVGFCTPVHLELQFLKKLTQYRNGLLLNKNGKSSTKRIRWKNILGIAHPMALNHKILWIIEVTYFCCLLFLFRGLVFIVCILSFSLVSEINYFGKIYFSKSRTMVRGSRWNQHDSKLGSVPKEIKIRLTGLGITFRLLQRVLGKSIRSKEFVKVGEHILEGFYWSWKVSRIFQLIAFRNCPLQLLSHSLLTPTEFFVLLIIPFQDNRMFLVP